MPYKLKIPARMNLLGNPSDANEGDFATISAAVDIYAFGRIEKADKVIIEQLEHTDSGLDTLNRLKFNPKMIPLPYDGSLDLDKGGINRLYRFSPEFREKLLHHGFKISTWTDVPRQSWLGGSSLFILLTLGGLRALDNIDPQIHNGLVIESVKLAE